jgi:ArsR family transcriptional regulator
MKADSTLAGTATLFLALGDRTRLRLLNLIRDREICVSSFTEVLGASQPKISRHLAYLRNAGIVDVRRDGKWMYYSISTQLDENRRHLLTELFKWMEGQESLDGDRGTYVKKFGGLTIPQLIDQPRGSGSSETVRRPRQRRVATEPPIQNEPEPATYTPVLHNELEDFLL